MRRLTPAGSVTPSARPTNFIGPGSNRNFWSTCQPPWRGSLKPNPATAHPCAEMHREERGSAHARPLVQAMGVNTALDAALAWGATASSFVCVFAVASLPRFRRAGWHTLSNRQPCKPDSPAACSIRDALVSQTATQSRVVRQSGPSEGASSAASPECDKKVITQDWQKLQEQGVARLLLRRP
ncbi:hypothetical protein B0J13DRAFT_307129 [Dactylonectria estremocensis]|uniref:Uncharacterized protein n=1 Tax=Dactylonectria estremocensis TaxID=1079267 RepID=A0A9P9F0B9_9HYPO|nr:hypothetical protein B0J13DRAFT_307129 [Dactylonectria estremocensis]